MIVSYLNWAGLAPLTVRGYIHSLIAPEIFGNMLLGHCRKKSELLKERIASWLGCDPRQVAFVPSTSMALTVASRSLNWKEGDAVVFNRNDFAANVTPWLKLSESGVVAHHCEGWQSSDNWPASTRMVSISTVDYVTGVEQPWQEVVTKARQANIWTCVDAVQSAAVKPSYSKDIDFWCAGSQKWLGSGLGVAILVVSPRVLKELQPPFPTWMALNKPPYIESGFSDTARSWEMGWITPQAIARLLANFQYFEKVGWEQITADIKLRRDYLHERLLEMNYQVVSCPTRWSGIVSVDPGVPAVDYIVQDGYRNRIITAARGGCIRMSAHALTPMSDVNRAVDWLWGWKRRLSA